MKRVWMAVSVLGLVAAMGFAATNEVTSVNIVGYNTAVKPAGGQFNLIGIQFDAFDPTLLGVLGTNQLTAGLLPQLADRVYVYDASKPGYNTYAMRTGANGFRDTTNWHGTNVNPKIEAGTAMWILAKAGAMTNLLTIAGEAVDVGTQSVDIVSGFQLLAYPFSCEIDLNDTDLPAQGTKGLLPQLSDRVYVWNGAGYTTYGLHNVGEFRSTTAWSTPATPGSALVPLGTAMWYEARKGFNWQESNKYLSAFNN